MNKATRTAKAPRLLPRLRVCATAALLAAAFASPTASAFQQPPSAKGLPAFEAEGGIAVRAERLTTWGSAPRASAKAWTAFQTATGGAFRAMWDPATGVPLRLWGRGFAAPGVMASPEKAEKSALSFLGQHLALLAPGASIGDFVLAANDLSGGQRTVSFYQHKEGLRVLGGQLSFRFKNDRLLVIASEALPSVRAKKLTAMPSQASLEETARAWIASDRGAIASVESGVEGPFVLPLVGNTGVLGYRTVVSVVVSADQPIGKWTVYLDAQSGAPVAREQTLRFAQGTLLYNAPDRYPLSTRSDYPAPNVTLTVDGAANTSDVAGLVVWPTATQASVVAQLAGPLVDVDNSAGAQATKTLPLDPSSTAVWNESGKQQTDAELSSYIHTHIVKAYAKKVAPQMSWLNAKIQVTVNINDQCNAFSDGTSINFYDASNQCENTGRLADVVYHEFGHSFHNHAIIPGVGAFEGALSEGVSDYLAATITGDPGTARGFFYSSQPLRDIDPANSEAVWPDDIDGDVHETGLIIAGALWDLRKLLVTKLGDPAGPDYLSQLYYEMLKRSVDIPSTYVEMLAADDDDGDLENGTPNVCEINEAFGLHGLRSISASTASLGVQPPTAEGYEVTLELAGLYPQCAGDALDSVYLNWRLRSDKATGGTIDMPGANGLFGATIPAQKAGQVIQYQVVVGLAGQSPLTYPENPADLWYELYVGDVEPIYCTDFETDPLGEGWTHGLTAGSGNEGADDWQWGKPNATPGSGDPAAAFSGTRVFGNDLGGGNFNGLYQGDKVNYALSPAIDVAGHPSVRLQYMRWLNVEDGHFDTGSIYANDDLAWQNANSNNGNGSSVHHTDKEWRFHDVDLTSFVKNGQVQIKYEIASDAGFELGGWTLDDFCIVGTTEAAPPACGDGFLDPGEACDDGGQNSDSAKDACRTDCTAPTCGDGVTDSGEDCDDANFDETDGCDSTCAIGEDMPIDDVDGEPTPQLILIDNGCGCRTAGEPEQNGTALSLVGLAAALIVARRKRG